MSPGISHVEMPFQPGVPRFTLQRAGAVLAEFSGRQEIIREATEANSVKAWRASNRTWSGAWCLGEVKRFAAEAATPLGDAKRVDATDQKAVRIPATVGSGLEFASDETLTRPLNIRVRYMNPSPSGCRLTLTAGAGQGRPAVGFPVGLPAGWTREGRVSIATTDVLQGAHAVLLQRDEATRHQSCSATSPSFPVGPGTWEMSCAVAVDLASPDASYNGTVTIETLDDGGSSSGPPRTPRCASASPPPRQARRAKANCWSAWPPPPAASSLENTGLY